MNYYCDLADATARDILWKLGMSGNKALEAAIGLAYLRGRRDEVLDRVARLKVEQEERDARQKTGESKS